MSLLFMCPHNPFIQPYRMSIDSNKFDNYCIVQMYRRVKIQVLKTNPMKTKGKHLALSSSPSFVPFVPFLIFPIKIKTSSLILKDSNYFWVLWWV